MTIDYRVVDAARAHTTFRRLTPERHPSLAQCTRDVTSTASDVVDVEARAEAEDSNVRREDDVPFNAVRRTPDAHTASDTLDIRGPQP